MIVCMAKQNQRQPPIKEEPDMTTTTVSTTIPANDCLQRRDQMIHELKALSEQDMRELGIWCDSIDDTVSQLMQQMGCSSS